MVAGVAGRPPCINGDLALVAKTRFRFLQKIKISYMEDNGRRYNSEVFGEEGALALTVLCMAVAVRAMGLKVLIVQKEDERRILMRSI